jgi:hypothetical protein
MMADRRRKNMNWFVADDRGNTYQSTTGLDGRSLAVLMDIRDELLRLNKLLYCSSFLAVPQKLERIARNTSRIPIRRKKGVSANARR